MIDYSLYLVTDDPSRYAGNWLDNVLAAVEGGVTCVQYRDTESAPDVRYARVRALQDALAGRVPLIVNNEADLAATIRAEGVHVGQGDLPPAAVRAIVGPLCEIGLSITDISQVPRLVDDPCVDAVGIGPVFDARKTKADASEAMGLAGLSDVIAHLRSSIVANFKFQISDCKFPAGGQQSPAGGQQSPAGGQQSPAGGQQSPAGGQQSPARGQQSPAGGQQSPTGGSRLPTVAIGGVTLENAASVLACGVDGLAVVSAFSKSSDPYETARNFTLLSDHRRK